MTAKYPMLQTAAVASLEANTANDATQYIGVGGRKPCQLQSASHSQATALEAVSVLGKLGDGTTGGASITRVWNLTLI